MRTVHLLLQRSELSLPTDPLALLKAAAAAMLMSPRLCCLCQGSCSSVQTPQQATEHSPVKSPHTAQRHKACLGQWQMSWCPGAAHRSATNEWMRFCTLHALGMSQLHPKLCSAFVAHPPAGRCSFQLHQTNLKGIRPWPGLSQVAPSLLATAAGGRGLQATGNRTRTVGTMWAAGC